MQLFQPLVLLFLIALLSLLARKPQAARYLQHLQKRNSLMHVLWLVILQAYTITALMSMALLICVQLGDGNYVLYYQGTVQCYKGDHLPYAIFAVIVLAVFIIPPPFLILTNRVNSWPSLKGLLDEATHIYKDRRRWWLSVNLLRRLIFAAMADFLPEGPGSRIAFTAALLVYLLLHDYFR